MRRLAVLGCLTACGRLGFGPDTPTPDSSPTVDAAVTTGPMGPRWIRTFTDDVQNAAIGSVGDVHLIARMSGPFSAEPNVSLTPFGFIATAYIHYDASGNVLDSTILDSNGFCDIRSIAFDGPDLVLSGFTEGTTSVAGAGACSIATNRQDPIALRIDPQGQQSLVAHWSASGANAQAWYFAVMPDHSLTMGGIYGSALQIGSFAMPTGIVDPSAWIARTNPAAPTDAAWARGFTADVEIHGGPIVASGDDVCAMGAYRGNTSVFGKALPYAGGYDAWVARVDGGGTERFVRGFGSPGDEPSFGIGSLIATADGGCLVGVSTLGDVTLDTVTYPMSAGGGLIVRFAADSSVLWARRAPDQPFFTVVGNRTLAAYTIGGDVRVVELDAAGAETLVGVVGGAGTQTSTGLATAGPDAVVVSLQTTGALTFGATSSDSGTTTLAAVGVLGI